MMNELKKFLDGAPSVYHAVAALENMLVAEGYVPVTDDQPLLPGGKYYTVKGGSTIMAFRLPEGKAEGFMISASHSDRPGFRVKEGGELKGKYTRLSVEGYGGMIMHSWLDRPLSLAGRVLVETEKGVESRLVDLDRDLLLIPNVAIHMNRSVNDGQKWNPAVDMQPVLGGPEAEGKLWALVEQAAGGKVLGSDLYLYIREKARIWGVEEEYISSAGLDDLEAAWCCARGFLQAAPSRSIPVLCVFDSEEVGSGSGQGAGSTVLERLLERIARDGGYDLDRLLGRTFLLSVDNAHALHPNHPEYSDATNAPLLGGGVVLKFNANLRYTTDGVSSAVFRKLCAKAQVPVQTYWNRADLPGGTTLGGISLGHVSVPSADIGLAQLAMHSAYETAGVKDVEYLVRALETFYGSSLIPDGKDGWEVC